MTAMTGFRLSAAGPAQRAGVRARARALVLAVLGAAGLGSAALCHAQASVSEFDVKAALVFNFARYVEWPERAFASREAPLVLCVMGRDRFGTAFTALDGRKLQGRALKVRVGVTPEDSTGCHVAFVGDATERQVQLALRAVAGQPVLTVGDSEGFIDSGGAIGIVQGEQRLQFEVSRTALDQAQLKASSQLLKLARAVLGRGPE